MKKKSVLHYFFGLSNAGLLYLLMLFSLILKIYCSDKSFQIPEFATIIIFYQIIHHELKLNIYFLIIYSIFQDIFQDLPLGTMFLGYFTFIKLLETNRRYIFDHGEVISLVSFGLAFTVILLVKAMLFASAYGISQIQMHYYVLELLYMVGYYPLFHTALNKTTQACPNE